MPEAWWTAYAVVLLIGLTFALWSLVGFAMRRVTRFTYPLPPAEQGGRPGCRVCGAELDGQGTIQRCAYCSSDHIVIGDRYQRHARRIDDALDAMEAQLDTTLAKRDAWGKVLVAVTLGASLAVLMLVPAAGFFIQPATAPALWWIPVALLAFAAVANRLQRRWLPVPNVRGLPQVHAGNDQVVVGGQVYEVASRVAPTGSDMYDKPLVVMLASDKQARPSLAVVCYLRDQAGDKTSAHEVVSESREEQLPEGEIHFLYVGQDSAPARVELAGKRLERIVAKTPGALDEVRSWTFRPSQLGGADVYVVQDDNTH